MVWMKAFWINGTVVHIVQPITEAGDKISLRISLSRMFTVLER